MLIPLFRMQELSQSTPKHKLTRCGKEYPNPLLLKDKMQHLFIIWSLKSQLFISFSKASLHVKWMAHPGSFQFLKRSKLIHASIRTLFRKYTFSTWDWGVTSKVYSSEMHCLTSQQTSFQISPPALFILFNYLDFFFF